MDHKHRYYFQTTKKEFLPVDPEKHNEEDLYKMVEFAILMCNCTDVIKVKVEKGHPNGEET